MPTPTIREINKADNPHVAKCVRDVLVEFGVPKVGTAYEDASLDCMFETYDNPKMVYLVLEENSKIIGSAGIAKLDNYDGNICELQKMYFAPEARGRGLGTKMITKCLEYAKDFGFDACYLETMPYMDAARALYAKNGFEIIDKSLGNTGHYSCTVYMLKNLKD
jgi:putative acetyltransferase